MLSIVLLIVVVLPPAIIVFRMNPYSIDVKPDAIEGGKLFMKSIEFLLKYGKLSIIIEL